jgi:hypothetical protein
MSVNDSSSSTLLGGFTVLPSSSSSSGSYPCRGAGGSVGVTVRGRFAFAVPARGCAADARGADWLFLVVVALAVGFTLLACFALTVAGAVSDFAPFPRAAALRALAR